MKTAEFIALSASTMALTALGIDIMLPAFAQVRAEFGLPPSSTETAKIISFFFMGQVAQIIFGVLSDRYGRLSVLRLGFPLYAVAGVLATFAPSLPIMYAARFLMGMGASALFMCMIACVRDRYVGDEMARIMSLIFTIFLMMPVIAPFLGAAILAVSSWKMVFLTPSIVAVVVFFWSLRLEESLAPENRVALKWANVSGAISAVMSNRVFIRYTAVTTILFTALSSYVATSEHIVGEIYGKPKLFPWIFGSMGLLMSACTLMNSRLSKKYGARTVIRWLLMAYTVVGAILLVCTYAFGDPPDMRLFFVAVAFMLAINLAVEPNSSSLAMEPMGATAGMASSIYGTAFFFVGATLGSFISHLMSHTVMPLVLSFFVFGVFSVILVLSDSRPKTS